jgi:hypothetical protein
VRQAPSPQGSEGQRCEAVQKARRGRLRKDLKVTRGGGPITSSTAISLRWRPRGRSLRISTTLSGADEPGSTTDMRLREPMRPSVTSIASAASDTHLIFKLHGRRH